MKDCCGERFNAREYVVIVGKDREFKKLLRGGFSPIGVVNMISSDNTYMWVNFSKRTTKEYVTMKVEKSQARKLRVLTGVKEVIGF